MSSIYEIAKQLGMSARTVSRVINDSPLVSAKTKQRVRDHFQQVGFSPSAAARTLVRGRADVVGIVSSTSRAHYVMELLFALECEISRRGTRCLMFTAHNAEDELAAVRALRASDVDGLFFLSAFCDDATVAALATENPKIIFGHGPKEFHLVRTSQVAGIHDLLRQLAEGGHRKIAFMGPPESMYPGHNERRDAYDAGMKRLGLGAFRTLYQAPTTLPGAFAEATRLLRAADRPTAIMCFNDEMAMGTIKAAQELGVRVPEELSITGFDGLEFGQYFTPALTTYRINPDTVARQMANTLFALMQDSETRPAQVTVVGKLLKGKSVAPAC